MFVLTGNRTPIFRMRGECSATRSPRRAMNECFLVTMFILKGEKWQLTVLCRDYIYLLLLHLFVVIIFFPFQITSTCHSDHPAFFRRTLGTRLGSKYKPYWNYICGHMRGSWICSKGGLRRKRRDWGEHFGKFANVAPGFVLYRFRGVTTITITIRPSWNFLTAVELHSSHSLLEQ